MVKNRQILFDYRKDIPSFIFKELPKEKYFSHPIRRQIVKLLKEGIKEKSPDGKFNNRYALNVREIRDQLKKSYDKTPNITALYFHLDILSDLGLIKVVVTLNEGPHGRNKTKYYGRISRHLILYNIDEECENYKLQFKEFEKLAKFASIKVPKNLTDIGKQYSDKKKENYQILGKWLIDHEEIIEKENLNLSLLFEFLKNIVSIHPEHVNQLGDLFSVLQENIEEI
ncbi:MAG: winged helix-turn-helix transcriptional regulator [Asgard group archaeon]|nr:winged helix-turn-helix transcriptional regulator [Asgard group archaeon]